MERGSSLIRQLGQVAARIAMLSGLVAASSSLALAAAGPVLSNGWIRVLTQQLPAAGYFLLTNPGDRALLLTAATSPACGNLMLHESIETNGTVQMTMVKSIVVPAHGRLEFRPGGYHLMCMSPESQLAPGNTVPVSLHFQDGASVTANFQVKNATGK